jgi:hypothetical protein
MPAAVYRADSMENVFRREPPRARRDGASGWATSFTSTDLVQFRHDGSPARAVYSAIHASSPRQCGIGRIDDCIDRDFRDIAGHQLDSPRTAGHCVWLGAHKTLEE